MSQIEAAEKEEEKNDDVPLSPTKDDFNDREEDQEELSLKLEDFNIDKGEEIDTKEEDDDDNILRKSIGKTDTVPNFEFQEIDEP